MTDEGSAADSNPRVVDEKELPSLPLNDKEFPSLPWSERELLFVPMRAVSTDYLKSVCSFFLLSEKLSFHPKKGIYEVC